MKLSRFFLAIVLAGLTSKMSNAQQPTDHSAGWKQLMNNHPKDGGPGVTDLWVRFENNAISNIAILLARANEVDFFVVSAPSARSTFPTSADISGSPGLKAACWCRTINGTVKNQNPSTVPRALLKGRRILGDADVPFQPRFPCEVRIFLPARI